jgi:hypothetical protein
VKQYDITINLENLKMTIELLEDPIIDPVKEVIALFNTELESVTFPELNAEILNSFVEQVKTKALELQELQAKVLNAKEALEASQNELLQKTTRALAYAKVYAEGKQELSEKLSMINLSTKSIIPRKKGTKSDIDSSEGEKVDKKAKTKKITSTEEVAHDE